MRLVIILLTAWFGFGLHGGAAIAGEPAASAAAAGSAATQPDAFFPQADYRFDGVLEGAFVMHEFVLQNRGSGPLEVEKVQTS